MKKANFHTQTPLTEDELRVVYGKLKKKEVIEMLIQNNKILSALLPPSYPFACVHNFVATDQNWCKCEKCGLVTPRAGCG